MITSCKTCKGIGLVDMVMDGQPVGIPGCSDVCRACEGTGVAREETPPPPPPKTSCNKHSDCDEADRIAKERGTANTWDRAVHCRTEDCVDCFGA